MKSYWTRLPLLVALHPALLGACAPSEDPGDLPEGGMGGASSSDAPSGGQSGTVPPPAEVDPADLAVTCDAIVDRLRLLCEDRHEILGMEGVREGCKMDGINTSTLNCLAQASTCEGDYDGCEPPYAQYLCTTEDDCNHGLKCDSGACVGCLATEHCRPSEVCHKKHCVADDSSFL